MEYMKDKLGSNEFKENRKMLALYTGIYAVCAILVYGWFIRYGRLFLFKNDGVQQHLSALIYYGRYLRNIFKELIYHHRIAIPLWDFCLGYGSDVFDTLHYYVIGDPFALLSVFVPQRYTEYLYCGLVILRSFVCGIAFYFFSIHKGNQKFSSMIGSLNYAFCGYVIYYGVRHPYFINAMIFLPVIMIGIDKIYQKKRPTCFMISVALAAISNFYFFYILSIFMVIYAVFEYFCIYRRLDWKLVGKEFIRFAGYYLVGILIAGFSLIPVIYATLTSSRIGNETAFSIFYQEWTYYAMFFIGFITTSEAPELIFGFITFAIPVVTLLFIRRKQNTILKIAYAVVFSMLSLRIVGMVMNGFSYSSLRYCFILSILVSYTIAKLLPEMSTLGQREKVQIAVISIGYIGISMVMAAYGGIKTSGALAIVTVIMFVAARGSGRLLEYAVVFVTVLSIAHNGYLYYSEDSENYILSNCAESQIDALTTDAQLNLIHALDDDSFYRSEAQRYILNTATAVDVPSTCYYYSLINGNLTEFMNSQGNMLSAMGYKLLDSGKRAILDSVFSIKYYVTDEGEQQGIPYGFDQCVLNQNGYAVYENSYVLPFGFTYENVISQSAYDQLPMLGRQYALLQAAAVPDEYVSGLGDADLEQTSYECEYETLASKKIRVEEEYILVKKARAKLKVRVKNVKGSELYICFRGLRCDIDKEENGKASFTVKNEENKGIETFMVRNLENKFYSGTEDFCVNAGYQDGNDAVIILQFNSPGRYYFEDFSFQAQPLNDFSEKVAALGESVLENTQFDVNRISGDIVLEKPKMLCLSIPYSRGWSVYVDGEKQDAVQINTVFTGIELSEGTHHVELRYVTPGLGVGIFLSVVGVVLLLVIHHRYGRKSGEILE